MKDTAFTKNDVYQRISKFITAIRQFSSNEFKKNEWHFCIVYGSYAYKIANLSSDLDILFVCNDVNAERVNNAIKFTNTLHKQFSMPLDHEIPYNKKLVLDRVFFESACNAKGVFMNSTWQLPVIKKTPEYLSSNNLLLRFFMGMMFNPHIFISGDYVSYSHYAILASQNLLRAIISINNLRNFTTKNLIQYFCYNNKNTGDLHIGFSEREPYISYLLERIEIILSMMPQCEITKKDNIYYVVNDGNLTPEAITC